MPSTATVRFTGICTHLTEFDGTNHRVVLVRADNGAYVNDAPIPPHIPKLRIDPSQITSIEGYPHGLEPLGQAGVWQMRGVALGLENGVGTHVEREDFEKVPRLECTTRPPASHEVTHMGQAAAYFELFSGTIRSKQDQPGAAIWTEATVDTEGDHPVLVVTCLWNRAQSRFHLTPGAVIDVEHTGHQKGDSNNDYLLHYRVLVEVPEDARIPHSERDPRDLGDISIGCSNSQYP